MNTWWYGFKEAEELVYEGYVPDYKDFLSNYIFFVKDFTSVGIPIKHAERRDGVLDYIKHWENNKNVITKMIITNENKNE